MHIESILCTKEIELMIEASKLDKNERKEFKINKREAILKFMNSYSLRNE